MDSSFVLRKPNIYNLSASSNAKILSPQDVAINFGGTTIDIGILCYRKIHRPLTSGALHFVPDSFVCDRRSVVKKLIEYSISLQGGISNKSNYSRMVNIQRFFLWCNENSLFGCMDFDGARGALETYVAYLREKVRLGNILNNTAQRYQYDAIYALRDGLELDGIHLGMRLLKKSRLVNHTEAPCDKDQGKVLALAQSLFYSLTDAIHKKSAFPIKIPVAPYLNRKNDSAWYFPLKIKWTALCNSNKSFRYYDYENGCVRDLAGTKFSNMSYNRRSYNRAVNKIRQANTYENGHWLSMAALSTKVFALLFSANTGMNKAQMINLSWCNDDFYVGKETQGFIEIKHRANDKEVSFTITADFLRDFEKYIALRRITMETFGSVHYLFFIVNPKLSNPVCRPKESILTSAIKSMRLIDPNLPNIQSMKWRAAKSHHLILTTDLHTAAEVMQNDVRTFQESYIEGSQKNAEKEVSEFLEKLSGRVLGSKSNELGLKTSAGSCRNYGSPRPDLEVPDEIQLDCKTAEGCFFCENYVVNADEVDIRKLLSCKFCIESTSHLSASIDHFNLLYGGVLERIDYFIKIIEQVSEECFESVVLIQKEVFDEGILDSYWESKLEQLMELGVI
jgi:hypothetical protein